MPDSERNGSSRGSGNCPPVAPAQAVAEQIQGILLEWGEAHFKAFPWRSPVQKWHGLIAEILLQRTRAKNVIPVYLRFVERFPLPVDLSQATVEQIEELIRPLGLRWRVPLLKQLGSALAEREAEMLSTEAGLLSLPGVGSYAAGAFLSFHMNVRSAIIDSNIVRFIGRLEDCPVNAETRRKRWLSAYVEAWTPSEGARDFNYALLDFTMEICAAVPQCEVCPLGPRFCAYRRRVLNQNRV